MELVSTMEINGEEREIADAVAREQCAANAEGIDNLNNNLDTLAYSENSINGNIVNGTNLIGTAVREGSFALSDSVVIPSGSNTISTVYFTDGTKSTLNFSFSDGSVALPNPTTSDFTVSHVYFNSVHVGKIIKNIQLEIGTTSKGELYYVSSNNKLTKEIHKLNDSLDGLENDVLTLQDVSLKGGVYAGDDGNFINLNNYMCSNDFIEITPNTHFKLLLNEDNDDYGLLLYDKDKNYLGRSNSFLYVSGNLIEGIIPQNAYYATINIHLYNGNFPTVYLYTTKIGKVVNQLKSDLGGLSFSASGTTLTITDGTNTWSLTAN